MKIDCHTHTDRFSGCAVLSPDDLLEMALEVGLDGVVLTEHDVLWPHRDLCWLRRAYPELEIFSGVEVSVGRDHVVVIPAGETEGITRCNTLLEVERWLREKGGFGFVAHPFRFDPEFDLNHPEYGLPGVEVASSNIPEIRQVRQALEYTRSQSASPVVASDAHGVEPVGDYYLELSAEPGDQTELVEALHSGDFTTQSPVDVTVYR